MKDEDRKRLTIFPGECWHEIVDRYDLVYAVCSCGDSGPATKICSHANIHRTFTTEADMMALYKRLHEAGKWEEFTRFMMDKTPYKYYNFPYEYIYRFTGWLFCLSGEGYEERCQMVNDFLEREGMDTKTSTIEIVPYSYENLKGVDES